MADRTEVDKGGRPTAFKEEYIEQVYKFCLLGLTDIEMANLFEVSESTFHEWKIKHPKFLESIRAGKEYADAEVARALYKRATGFEYTEKTVDKDSEGNETHTRTTNKVIIPDTKAAQIWLNNRNPNRWKERREIEHSVNIDDVKMPDVPKMEDENDSIDGD